MGNIYSIYLLPFSKLEAPFIVKVNLNDSVNLIWFICFQLIVIHF